MNVLKIPYKVEQSIKMLGATLTVKVLATPSPWACSDSSDQTASLRGSLFTKKFYKERKKSLFCLILSEWKINQSYDYKKIKKNK